MSEWVGATFLGPGWLLYDGPLGATALHSHHAVQVLVTRRGQVELRDAAGGVLLSDAAIIQADVRHATGSVESAVLVYLEPDSEVGRRRPLPRAESAAAWATDVALLRESIATRRPTTALDACKLAQSLVEALGPSACRPARPAPHPAIARSLSQISVLTALGESPSVARLAAAVGLSESHLSRVFNQRVGLSVPAYVRWHRLRVVGSALEQGRSLTDAAHSAGFSDSAHLSRVFKATFGVCPSELVGVHWCVVDLEMTDPFKPTPGPSSIFSVNQSQEIR